MTKATSAIKNKTSDTLQSNAIDSFLVDVPNNFGKLLNKRSCKSKGEPLIIHTKVLQNQLRGLNFDLKPKEIINPSGNDKHKVKPKSFRVIANPKPNLDKIVETSISYFPM